MFDQNNPDEIEAQLVSCNDEFCEALPFCLRVDFAQQRCSKTTQKPNMRRESQRFEKNVNIAFITTPIFFRIWPKKGGVSIVWSEMFLQFQ